MKTLPDGAGATAPEAAAAEISPGNEETSRTMWFENGPIFVRAANDGLPAYTPLVRYVTDLARPGEPREMMTGRDAVIAAPLGKRRVVIFGPHPGLSPGLTHWLANAVRWASSGNDGSPPWVSKVLEGRKR